MHSVKIYLIYVQNEITHWIVGKLEEDKRNLQEVYQQVKCGILYLRQQILHHHIKYGSNALRKSQLRSTYQPILIIKMRNTLV